MGYQPKRPPRKGWSFNEMVDEFESRQDRREKGSGLLSRIGCGVFAVIAFIVFVIVINPFYVVQPGFVGVRTNLGQVENNVLHPGLHWKTPILQSITSVDTRVHGHDFKQIDAASSEYQTVKLTGTMNFHLDGSKVVYLYQTVGLDFAVKVLDPAFQDFIKETVPQYSVGEILAKREEIRARAQKRLGENLSRYGIVVDDIYIANIAFSDEFQKAIEAKQVQQQATERESLVLAQKKIQADQAIVEAQGRATAAVATAKGEAEANEARTKGLSQMLIDYLKWQRWDGKLPTVTGGAVPMIEVKP